MFIEGNLGIDESNNGKFPCIYTGYFSPCRDDSEFKEGLIKREKGDNEIARFMGDGKSFRYVVFSERHGVYLSNSAIKIIALTELINAFPSKNIRNSLVDGELSDIILQEVYGNINPTIKIKVEPKADEKYPIVNVADKIARFLFRHYASLGIDTPVPTYEQFRIKPDISKYFKKQ